MTRQVDGHAMAAELQRDLAAQVSRLRRPPSLAVVLVSDDPRQHRYADLKYQAAASVGIHAIAQELAPRATTEELCRTLDDLVADADVDGVFIQLPLPAHLDPQALHDRLPPVTDVDGLSRRNRLPAGGRAVHRPAAVDAVLHVLQRHGIGLDGRRVVVVGASWDLGVPLRTALSVAGATVETVDPAAVDLPRRCRAADLVVSTVGVPHVIDGSCVKPGAAVVDAGGSITDDGPVGDVDLDAVTGLASLVAPHPGGIGPLTVACLLRSTAAAAGLWDLA
ncbi:MAG TPA: bifunctional 5,10-methylenetetrahydrofolate dehydrogenase/5,10-methenyltetrahydrofolate cyclohydrolase [Euzebya sp.]|nr:bifunctional 5,10-methylenetetrahydrofolate dehydrogenase/5,10-methenyltetrahydrofolate cyclohydrolase [Euzebya sp.]